MNKLSALLLLVGLGFAQTPAPPITTTQVNLPISTNLTPVSSAAVRVVGNPGPQTYYYWTVATYQGNATSPTGPWLATNAPNVLTGSNYDQINPVYPVGASVDVLRTSSSTPPVGTCNCAVVTGLTYGPALDISNSLSSYTVNPANPNVLNLTLDNEVQGAGASDLILRQNGLFIVDLSLSGGGGTVVGPGSSTIGDIAIWNSINGVHLADSLVAFPLGNASLQHSSTTVNGQTCALGATCTVTAVPSGSATGDISGTYPGPLTVGAVGGVPLCTGISPTNNQALEWTNASSPNPCLTYGTAGSLVNPMTTLGDAIYGGASGAPTRLAGATTPNGVPEFIASIPSGGVATAPVLALPGIVGRSVTGASDTIVSTDCNPKRIAYTGTSAVAVTLPTPTTLGVGNCSFKIANNTSATLTVTPTTWTISAGSGGAPAAALAILQGQEAILFVDPVNATNWAADVTEQGLSAGSGVSLTRSATGSTLAANVSSVFARTGAVTAASGDYTLDLINALAASKTIANGNNAWTVNSAQTSNNQSAVTFGETSAATGGTGNSEVTISTLANSASTPLTITQGAISSVFPTAALNLSLGANTGATNVPAILITQTLNNASITGGLLRFVISNTASAGTECALSVNAGAAGGTFESCLDLNGNVRAVGNFEATTTAATTTVVGGAGSASTNGPVGGLTLSGSNNSSTGGSATAGPVTLNAGDMTGAATNLPGADIITRSGLGTGNSTPSHVKVQMPTFSPTSGTTAQTSVTRYTIHQKLGSTTSATATNMFNVALANNQAALFSVTVGVSTTQATPHNCATEQQYMVVAQDTSGTITTNVSTVASSAATICDTGTLTLAVGASAASPTVFSVTPSWTTIVPVSVLITVEIHNLSQQDIALL